MKPQNCDDCAKLPGDGACLRHTITPPMCHGEPCCDELWRLRNIMAWIADNTECHSACSGPRADGCASCVAQAAVLDYTTDIPQASYRGPHRLDDGRIFYKVDDDTHEDYLATKREDVVYRLGPGCCGYTGWAEDKNDALICAACGVPLEALPIGRRIESCPVCGESHRLMTLGEIRAEGQLLEATQISLWDYGFIDKLETNGHRLCVYGSVTSVDKADLNDSTVNRHD